MELCTGLDIIQAFDYRSDIVIRRNDLNEGRNHILPALPKEKLISFPALLCWRKSKSCIHDTKLLQVKVAWSQTIDTWLSLYLHVLVFCEQKFYIRTIK